MSFKTNACQQLSLDDSFMIFSMKKRKKVVDRVRSVPPLLQTSICIMC